MTLSLYGWHQPTFLERPHEKALNWWREADPAVLASLPAESLDVSSHICPLPAFQDRPNWGQHWEHPAVSTHLPGPWERRTCWVFEATGLVGMEWPTRGESSCFGQTSSWSRLASWVGQRLCGPWGKGQKAPPSSCSRTKQLPGLSLYPSLKWGVARTQGWAARAGTLADFHPSLHTSSFPQDLISKILCLSASAEKTLRQFNACSLDHLLLRRPQANLKPGRQTL